MSLVVTIVFGNWISTLVIPVIILSIYGIIFFGQQFLLERHINNQVDN